MSPPLRRSVIAGCRERRGHHGCELVGATHRREVLGLDDRGRVAALGHELVEHRPARARGDFLLRDERDQARERSGAHPGGGGVDVGAEALHELVSGPVGQRDGLGGAPSACS